MTESFHLEDELSSTGNPSESSDTKIISRLVKTLNKKQKQAVFQTRGEVCVKAVPGSGKTRCLITRYLRLMDAGTKSSRILCCTFTKKAATEMQERIKKALPHKPFLDLKYVNTMHGIFYEALHDHPAYQGMDRIPVLSRNYKRINIIKDIAKTFGDNPKQLDMGHIWNSISVAKNELLTPEEYKLVWQEEKGEMSNPAGIGCRDVWDYYDRYEKKKDRMGYVDFDDMLYKTFDMFHRYPDILAQWQDRFDYILVDEFQDINRSQWEIVKLLAEPHGNLFVVGDPLQSIYRFRGSRPEFMNSFEREFPNARFIEMDQNYRSSDEVVAIANRVIDHSAFKSSYINGQGFEGTVYNQRFNSYSEEAAWVCDRIEKMIRDDEVDPKDIAVLYRTHANSRLFETGLAKAGISYRTRSQDSFFNSMVVKDIMCYLEAAVKDYSPAPIEKIINRPSRYLGAAFVRQWKNVMDVEGVTPKQALLSRFYEKDYWRTNAAELYYHLEKIAKLYKDPMAAVQYIRKEVGYDDWSKEKSQDENQEVSRRDLLDELEYMASQSNRIQGLLKVSYDANRYRNADDGVSLLTVHASKGLEFKHVFFVALNEGTLPHKRSQTDEDYEEERRLFYVGITRAEKFLSLTSHTRDNDQVAAQSRYLDEVQEVITNVSTALD